MHQFGSSDSGLLALCRHQRHFVTLEAHDIAAQSRLIGIDESIGVVGYITCSQYSHHAGHLEGSTGINLLNSCVWTMGEDDLQMEHARSYQIGWIEGCTGDFAQRVCPWQRCADQIGCHA